jgi:hypothetical protein
VLIEKREEHSMRIKSLAVVAVLGLMPWPAVAQDTGTADLQDYTLENGQDLADLCAVDAGNDLYAEAKQFCFGFLSGVVHFHDALAAGPEFGPIVCPEREVTRADGVEMYVAWANAHPDEAAGNNPAEAVVMAALDAWGPCAR